MEPISGQRKAVFVLVVLVLAGLGAYLLVPSVFGARPASRAGRSSPPGTGAGNPATSAPVAAAPPVPTATATGGAAESGAPDIYQWLPFTRPELGAAASVVTKFGVEYGTFSYTENSARYVGVMRNLITPALSEQLARAYAAPGVAGPRVSDKQVATGKAAISALRAFGGSSLTFVVAISQQIAGSKGRSKVSGQYSVTVTGAGSSWLVSDIELASAGNT
jgi:hypothetical protein